MSSISLKTFSLLSHWGLTATSYMCVGQRTSKKLSHNSEHSKASLSPPDGHWEGGTCVLLQCASLPATTCSAPKMSKNSPNCPLLLTGGDRHFFTDTLCSLSAQRTPMLIFLLCPEFPENQICAPQKSDFSGKKIISQILSF